MHNSTDTGNAHESATRFGDSAFVSHAKSFHQSAAMSAAQMIRFQYTRESKNEFRRECLDHLKASLAHGKEVSA